MPSIYKIVHAFSIVNFIGTPNDLMQWMGISGVLLAREINPELKGSVPADQHISVHGFGRGKAPCKH